MPRIVFLVGAPACAGLASLSKKYQPFECCEANSATGRLAPASCFLTAASHDWRFAGISAASAGSILIAQGKIIVIVITEGRDLVCAGALEQCMLSIGGFVQLRSRSNHSRVASASLTRTWSSVVAPGSRVDHCLVPPSERDSTSTVDYGLLIIGASAIIYGLTA